MKQALIFELDSGDNTLGNSYAIPQAIYPGISPHVTLACFVLLIMLIY